MKAAVVSNPVEPTKLTEVKEIPKPKIQDNEILVKAKAYAINPTDWKHIVFKMSKPGDVAGSDASGIVEEVGSQVTTFKKGDNVSSLVIGNVSPDNGAFAEYFVAKPQATIKYDHDLVSSSDPKSSTIDSFEGAASVTIGLCTVGISFSHYLNIAQHKKEGDSILIWGGATATGILAIQVAKLVYNLNVITTASPKNHEYLKELGADYTLDYNDADVVSKLQSLGHIKFGLDTIGNQETFQKLYDATTGTPEVFLDSLSLIDGNSIKTNPERKVHWGYTLGYLVVQKEKVLGTKKLVQTPELVHDFNAWWGNVLPTIINKVKHANLKILDGGLASANEGLQLSRDNKVSGQKIVFRAA
ncbi:zinc-binding dehydrogenase, putative [Candida dubliniensis CD36]|uniref:Zinc-binding dehydrogenase, putative n=1 Tax=Candida dubliniensis (strain CD36 / ATCC MYA-646 / CBS 7987 / NCPF 3949 / NRRL Y-17841) TaxID=573826 RepID=B9WJD6_CANDC|nr:zinc-binding dehydrogenase, putative [Candida dubliniensis CD36]CAX41359.1 zinc-binding dehydrogenase, putative [Candida dubliniensis CD36]